VTGRVVAYFEKETMGYDEWLEAVDAYVLASAGCSIHDLPDCSLRLWHDDGMPPKQAAREALREAGFEEGNL